MTNGVDVGAAPVGEITAGVMLTIGAAGEVAVGGATVGSATVGGATVGGAMVGGATVDGARVGETVAASVGASVGRATVGGVVGTVVGTAVGVAAGISVGSVEAVAVGNARVGVVVEVSSTIVGVITGANAKGLVSMVGAESVLPFSSSEPDGVMSVVVPPGVPYVKDGCGLAAIAGPAAASARVVAAATDGDATAVAGGSSARIGRAGVSAGSVAIGIALVGSAAAAAKPVWGQPVGDGVAFTAADNGAALAKAAPEASWAGRVGPAVDVTAASANAAVAGMVGGETGAGVAVCAAMDVDAGICATVCACNWMACFVPGVSAFCVSEAGDSVCTFVAAADASATARPVVLPDGVTLADGLNGVTAWLAVDAVPILSAGFAPTASTCIVAAAAACS
jgi:hypothetical protein